MATLYGSRVIALPYAQRPAVAQQGDIFVSLHPASNEPDGAEFIFINGSWRPKLDGILGYEPPLVSNFTWGNQGSNVAYDAGGRLQLVGPGRAGSFNGAVFYQVLSGIRFVEACLSFTHTMVPTNTGRFPYAGLHLVESSTSKLSYFVAATSTFQNDAGTTQGQTYFSYGTKTDPTGTGAANTNAFLCSAGGHLWLRMDIVGTVVTMRQAKDPRPALDPRDPASGWAVIGTVTANPTSAYNAGGISCGADAGTDLTTFVTVRSFRVG